MRSSRKWFVVAVPMFALGYATVGCTFEAGVDVPGTGGAPPIPPAASGTLTQRWSIGSQFNPRLCVTYGADRMQLVIRDHAGRLIAQAFQPCEEMQMSVKLIEGSYLGDTWLIASDGSRVSTTLSLRPFQIRRNTETFIDTDFPISSLLTAYGALESSEPDDEPTDEDDEQPVD